MRFGILSALIGLGFVAPAAMAQSSTWEIMREDSVPAVCEFLVNENFEENCGEFRLAVDGPNSLWSFNGFPDASVMIVTSSTSYDIREGYSFYRIREKYVNGRQFDASGTCVTRNGVFREAVCIEGDLTYQYRY